MRINITLSFILISICLQSQTIDNNKAHRRYWYYRTRMINDFMKIGKNQGDCIVFPERNITSNGVNPAVASVVGPDQIDITNQYMMALALEYKILSRNHQSTDETIKELYHLLYAVNRLDLEAEQFFDGVTLTNQHVQATGLLNGFMLREDMPIDYFTANNSENLVHYNYELLEHNYPNQPTAPETYGGFTGLQHTNQEYSNGKFIGYFAGDQASGELVCPQDKYQSLLVALMFISKYIPDGVSYNGEQFQDGETSLKQEAKNIANRCYNYLDGPSGWWALKLINSGGSSLGGIPSGGGAWSYSWPLSREACMVNRPFPWTMGSFNSLCSGYNDAFAITLGRATYDIMSTNPNYANDIAVFMAWSQSGSNSDPVSSSLPISLMMQQNTALHNLEWAELLRKVLHQNQVLFRQLSIYSNPLEAAPCQGPYNYGSCFSGGWEWSSQDRLEHPEHRGAGCGAAASDNYGNYPGVDYMLLHNLYYEYQNQLHDGQDGNVGGWLDNTASSLLTWIYNSTTQIGNTVYGNGGSGSNVPIPGYIYAYNYMDNLDESVWPLTRGLGSIYGTTLNPSKVAVFQNLKSTAHIYFKASPAAQSNNTPSDVTYRAGKEITLSPGFQVDAGSTFHAYILRYVCTGNADAMNMRHIHDSTILANVHVMDYESDEMNPIPMHYIESPKSDADKTPVVPITRSVDNTLPLLPDARPFGVNDFAIQPNPSVGIFKVLTHKETEVETLSIRIYDMRGQLINSYADVTPEFEINLSGYSKGIYMVQLMSTSGKVSSKRVDIIE